MAEDRWTKEYRVLDAAVESTRGWDRDVVIGECRRAKKDSKRHTK